MNDLQLIKLAIDSGLLLSLLFFAFRFLRSQAPAVSIQELSSINGALKSAVKEADDATRGLHEQLRQKKDALDKLLFELQGSESRVSRAVSSSEECKHDLETLLKRAQAVSQEIAQARPERSVASREYEPTPSPQPRAPQKRTESRPGRIEYSREIIEEDVETFEPELPSFQDSVQPRKEVRRQLGERPDLERLAEARKPQPRVSTSRPIPRQYSRLKENIEVEVKPEPVATEETLQRDLEGIYSAAEELLKAGKSLEFVASTTRLSVDEVRLLSHMIDQEAAARSGADEEIVSEEESEPTPPSRSATRDSRLGVLGAMKRQTQLV